LNTHTDTFQMRNFSTYTGIEAPEKQCAKTTLLTMHHSEAIAQARPQLPPRLADRTVDIWEPLSVLADLAAGPWPELARQAAAGLTADPQGNNPIVVTGANLSRFSRFTIIDRFSGI